MRDAGIIGFVPRGQYSPTETYDFLHFVYYDDSTYVAKKETTGNTPVENNEYWQLLAKGRAVGVTGVKGNAETAYRTGDVNITAENVAALPLTGGIISSNENPLLLLERKGGNFSGLEFKNQNGHLFVIEGYSGIDGAARQINIFVRDWNKSLLRINEGNRLIYDYKTKSEKTILIEDDVKYNSGDVVSIASNTPFVGILTTGSTEIYFTIPLHKNASGKTVAVTCTNLRVRGNAGYLIENKDISQYKIKTVISSNLLSICISQTSGEKFYETNNITVTAAGNFTITFS